MMVTNRAVKALCSIPIIIITSYFLPVVSVCLMIARFFVYDNKKYYATPLILMIIGGLVLLPKAVGAGFELADVKIADSLLWSILDSDLYLGIFNCGKFLMVSGIILLITSFLFRNLLYKLSNYIKSYINRREEIYREVSQKNDMEMREKQEKAKNTHVVYCPFCGADNILTARIGKCKYCRRTISLKD